MSPSVVRCGEPGDSVVQMTQQREPQPPGRPPWSREGRKQRLGAQSQGSPSRKEAWPGRTVAGRSPVLPGRPRTWGESAS